MSVHSIKMNITYNVTERGDMTLLEYICDFFSALVSSNVFSSFSGTPFIFIATQQIKLCSGKYAL
jgi:hypothetical protein